MANVLGELFQKIADAIREQTGETGTMKPADFPGAILGIEAGSDITLIDNIDITPDFSNGNQFVVAAEGYAVKGATILKPETLIPENIADGVEIAGIIGSLIAGTGGSGSALQFANGSFNTGTTGVERVTITHGKNVMPDFIAVWKTGIATMDASTRPFMSAWGMKSKFASGPQAAVCCAGYALAENDNGIDKATESQQNSGYIFCPNETTFQVGRIDSGNGQCLFVPNSAYNWIAIYGMGGGGSSADVRYVTFMNRSGTKEYGKKAVAYGDDCADPIARGIFDTPTEESTAQFHFTFSGGWATVPNGGADANALKAVTEDRVVYANFIETLRYYTITWLDSDGVTELPGQKQWAYGSVPSYTPTKEGAAFDGWTPSPVYVTGDATYTAKWIEVIGGSCGDDARWTYNVNTKTLTISGTGSTAQYTNDFNQPWNEYNAEIETVVVNEGITWLGQIAGSYIFANLTALKNVSLPNTLTHIWEGSFFQCTALESIEIPASVTTIYRYSFRYCSALANVTLHDGLTQIGERSFQMCYALKEFIMPNTVKTISSYAFDNSGLTSVTISGSAVWYDGTFIFNNCSELANVTLNDGLTRISNFAFRDCAVTSITIPDSVTYIGQKAFNNKLTSATFNNPNGWWVSTSSSATSGTSVTVTNPATAATLLGSTYKDYYWKRT